MLAGVRYGRFVDDKVDHGWDWDCMPIGMHNGIRRAESKMAKTSGNEYYYETNGKITILKNPSVKEMVVAQLKYLFCFDKKKLIGYRKRCVLA